jgi:predicted GNAT family acetyltransferase
MHPIPSERAMPVAIRHEPDAHRFIADLDGAPAYITYREIDGTILDLDHTFVPRAHRGGGIASELTARALDYARERGFKVVPSCPFVAAYVARHPKYRELLA